MNAITSLLTFWNDYGAIGLQVIAYLVLAASVVTAATNSTSKNRHLMAILRVLNWVALNIGKNRNADAIRVIEEAMAVADRQTPPPPPPAGQGPLDMGRRP